jgi:predicted amidohydrolase YtcJ
MSSYTRLNSYALKETLLSRRNFLKIAAAAAAPAITGGFGFFSHASSQSRGSDAHADLIVINAKVATMAQGEGFSQAFAIRDNTFVAVGDNKEIMQARGPKTTVIDANKRTIIPGLNDSHTHVIRGGLNYNMELRWDGIPSLALALEMLKEQAQRTPPPQWVRVIGGWSEFQFAEKRMPTLDEINAAAPDTPVLVVHLYARALLNKAALRALGITKETPNPPGGLIQKDIRGNPTGLLIAEPNAYIVYSTIARAPRLSKADQINSSRHFMRELNRLGVTSVIDAGGGGQNFPEDYEVINSLHDRGQLTLRFAYNLFAQTPGKEFSDFSRWVKMTKPGSGDAHLRVNGAGENLVWSAADFENFLLPSPHLKSVMEKDLEQVVRLLAAENWPFRVHATYNETIERFLNIFDRVNRDIPLDRLNWLIDHAETITPQNIARVKKLGGGIAVQHRMAYQGEYFIRRYGEKIARQSPPLRRMLEMGVPVGGGTDATRVSGYNPWITLYWLTTGKTVGGTLLYDKSNRLDRMEALQVMTTGSAWFSREQAVKGTIEPGKYADFAILSDDYFSVADEKIRNINAVLTVLGGKVVHADAEFKNLGPPELPVSPDWSPIGKYGGYYNAQHSRRSGASTVAASSLLSRPRSISHAHDDHHHTTVFSDKNHWNLDCPCYLG